MHFKTHQFLFSFLLLCLLPQLADGQIWTRIYWYTSGQKSDRGMSIIEADNGSLIAAGGYLGHLVKIDKNGNILWRKSYQEIEQTNDLTLTSDGGICLIGNNSITKKKWLIKTDATGKKLWERQMGTEDVSNILENNDGGFTILGKKIEITDSEGNLILQSPSGIGSFITRFVQLQSGHYVIAGESKVVVLDEQAMPFLNVPLTGARSVAATSDGNFLVMGYSESDTAIYLTKLNLSGNELWRKSYPQLDVRPFQYLWNKMVVTQNDEIAFIAYVDGVSAFIAKTDSEGNLLCARTQELNNIAVTMENLVATSDNGFALVGTAQGPDLFVMKTDSICQTADLEIIYNVDGEVDTVYSKEFSFKYGPNPCSNLVTFEIQPTKPFDGKMMLVFYDAYGRTVKSEKVSSGTLPVFTDTLPSGMYIFRFIENGKTLGKGKLAVQR